MDTSKMPKCEKCNKPLLIHYGGKCPPTQKQLERQNFREKGKYAKVNPCDVCGKSAGIDYYSHPDTDKRINDELICLCKKCYDKLSKYSGKEAIKIAFKKNGGQNGN